MADIPLSPPSKGEFLPEANPPQVEKGDVLVSIDKIFHHDNLEIFQNVSVNFQ